MNDIVIFESEGRPVEVQLDAGTETVWLTQVQMAELFDTSTDNVSLHLKNIYKDNGAGRKYNYRGFLGSSS